MFISQRKKLLSMDLLTKLFRGYFMQDKIFYNEASAKSLGWEPSWLGAKEFDDSLIRKIRAFQRENGLKADGLLGPSSYRRLVAQREAQEEYENSVEIGEGEKYTLIKRKIPDLDFTGSNATEPTVQMTVTPRNFPGNTATTEPDKNVIETSVNVYTEQVYLRARARQMGFKITSNTLGTTWKLGSPRLDGRPDGRR